MSLALSECQSFQASSNATQTTMKLKSKVPTEDEIAKAKEEATLWAKERLADQNL